MGRAYICWMLNWWCITWPVGFKRLVMCVCSLALMVWFLGKKQWQFYFVYFGCNYVCILKIFSWTSSRKQNCAGSLFYLTNIVWSFSRCYFPRASARSAERAALVWQTSWQEVGKSHRRRTKQRSCIGGANTSRSAVGQIDKYWGLLVALNRNNSPWTA